MLVHLQVCRSPSSLQLLSILQALLLLGPDRADIWQTLEALTNRAILLDQDCESSEAISCPLRELWAKAWSLGECRLRAKVHRIFLGGVTRRQNSVDFSVCV